MSLVMFCMINYSFDDGLKAVFFADKHVSTEQCTASGVDLLADGNLTPLTRILPLHFVNPPNPRPLSVSVFKHSFQALSFGSVFKLLFQSQLFSSVFKHSFQAQSFGSVLGPTELFLVPTNALQLMQCKSAAQSSGHNYNHSNYYYHHHYYYHHYNVKEAQN